MAGEPAPAPLTPSVPIRRSVFPSHIVCLEDGKKLKLLKRHLQASYGLTPEHYRHKWGLPASYPMVAPDYARHRSSVAKQNGLGRKPRGSAPEQTNLTQLSGKPDLPAEPPVTRGRARRARIQKLNSWPTFGHRSRSTEAVAKLGGVRPPKSPVNSVKTSCFNSNEHLSNPAVACCDTALRADGRHGTYLAHCRRAFELPKSWLWPTLGINTS